MKFYYLLIISIGIMTLMALAGVDGVGTNIRTLLINNGTLIQPSTQYNGSITEVDSTITDIKSTGTSFWNKILIALLAMSVLGAVTGVQIGILGGSFDVPTAVKSIIAYGSFGFFVSDMWSLITLVFGYGVDWVSWFLGILIVIYVTAFAVSAIEFVGGAD